MNRELFALRTKQLAIVAIGALAGASLMAGGPAIAQQQAAEVTVVAPHAVHQQVGRTSMGVPIEIVSLTRHVGYGDLDLTTPSGVATFEKRISDTAKQACQQLDTLYPASLYPPDPKDQDCVATAIGGGMA
ncbi:MAG: UrcA family protein, partial [Caulobacterales bacterium]